MTEQGGTGEAGHRAAGSDAGTGGLDDERSGTQPMADELPRWQPFADIPAPGAASGGQAPSAMPTAAPMQDAVDSDSIVPDPLHDTPTYIPMPMGMTPGSVMPPADLNDVPSSTWITTAPQTAPAAPSRGSRIGRVVGAGVVVLIVGLVAAGFAGLLPSDKGKILFGTAAGKDLCSVSNVTTTVKTTDPIFFAAVLKDHMDGAQAIIFHITKDGTEFVSHQEPADGTEFDCYGNRDSLGALEVGNYVFEVIHNGTIEATGKLTVQ